MNIEQARAISDLLTRLADQAEAAGLTEFDLIGKMGDLDTVARNDLLAAIDDAMDDENPVPE